MKHNVHDYHNGSVHGSDQNKSHSGQYANVNSPNVQLPYMCASTTQYKSASCALVHDAVTREIGSLAKASNWAADDVSA